MFCLFVYLFVCLFGSKKDVTFVSEGLYILAHARHLVGRGDSLSLRTYSNPDPYFEALLNLFRHIRVS